MPYLNNVVIAIFALMGLASASPTQRSDCEQRRDEVLTSTHNVTGIVVPDCDEHGEYRPLQCFGDAIGGGRPYCACYDRQFGQIKGPSRKLLSCNCIRTHHDWENNREFDRRSEPRCNSTTGEFDPMQCNSTHHWCVHEETGNQYGYERIGGCSTDLSTFTCGRDIFLRQPGAHHDDSTHGGESSSHGDPTHKDETSEQDASSSSQNTRTSRLGK
ncbi:U20-hexatoxin-Hi1a-like [Haemaphysalis longicornis]